MVSNSSSLYALDLAGSDKTYINGLTLLNSNYGIYIALGDEDTFNQVLSVNNNWSFYNSLQDNFTGSQIVSLSANIDFDFSFVSGGKFSDNLIFDNASPNCSGGGAAAGLNSPNCSIAGASNGTVVTAGIDSTTIFKGLLETDDPVNTSDNLGVRLFEKINDGLGFGHFFRSWGLATTPFPDITLRGKCAAGTQCGIYDWRLSTASALRNKSGDGLTANDPFVAGVNCPSEVDGAIVATNQNTNDGVATYLLNAMEIMRDGEGNENGLCESNESCIYMPHFGAYQCKNVRLSRSTLAQPGTF